MKGCSQVIRLFTLRFIIGLGFESSYWLYVLALGKSLHPCLPLSTQEYKWVSLVANNLYWSGSQVGKNISCSMLRKLEIHVSTCPMKDNVPK